MAQLFLKFNLFPDMTLEGWLPILCGMSLVLAGPIDGNPDLDLSLSYDHGRGPQKEDNAID